MRSKTGITEIDNELERLRAQQAKKVMRKLGPLLDAWDGLPNDVKCVPELREFRRKMAAVYRAVGE